MHLGKRNLLINASAAKYGGAKAIVEKFIFDNDFSKYKEVVILVPFKIDNLKNNIRVVNVSTSGIGTLFFTCIGIIYYCMKFKVRNILSFNNLNLIIPGFNRISYFHMPHTFYKKTLKHKIYRFIISNLLKSTSFVVQTKFVRDEFFRVFGKDINVSISWPGVFRPPVAEGAVFPDSQSKRLTCVIPIIDLDSEHKNFNLFMENYNDIATLPIDFYVTADERTPLPGVNYIGLLDRYSLNNLYSNVDFMLFPSNYETLGLPIFEFASTGKPVLVLNRPYLEGIEKVVGLSDNIIRFDDNELIERLNDICKRYDEIVRPPFPDDHLILIPNWKPLLV